VKYKGRSFVTVEIELGVDEIGGVSQPIMAMAPQIIRLFADLGLEVPAQVSVLAGEFQIAQKLHACTVADKHGKNQRAHDLIDIQLLSELETINLARLSEVGRRTFAYRRVGNWPPSVQSWPGWDDLYAAAAQGLQVRGLAEAISWANELIASADLAFNALN
jgi:hypothetical protein